VEEYSGSWWAYIGISWNMVWATRRQHLIEGVVFSRVIEKAAIDTGLIVFRLSCIIDQIPRTDFSESKAIFESKAIPKSKAVSTSSISLDQI
jgi:hypothetical protein